MDKQKKRLGVIACVLIPIGILATYMVLQQVPEHIRVKEEHVEHITMTYENQEVSINDDQEKDQLITHLETLDLKPLVEEVVPRGWRFNVSFKDKASTELMSLIIVGEHLYYKDKWYSINEDFLLDLRKFFNNQLNQNDELGLLSRSPFYMQIINS